MLKNQQQPRHNMVQIGLGIATSKPDYLERETVSTKSLSFDGTNDYVSFTAYSYEISGLGKDLSISFWAKRTDNNDEAVVLGNSSSGSFKRLYFDSDGDRLYIESDLNGQEAYASVTADTNWHHYVIASLGSAGGAAATVAVYEDGSSLTVTNTNFGAHTTTDITLNRIGADVNTDGTKEFKGLLYQVAIFNKTLNDGQVTAIYNSGNPIPLQENLGEYVSAGHLLNLWKFSEGSGETVADFGELERTGAITNATFSSTTP